MSDNQTEESNNYKVMIYHDNVLLFYAESYTEALKIGNALINKFISFNIHQYRLYKVWDSKNSILNVLGKDKNSLSFYDQILTSVRYEIVRKQTYDSFLEDVLYSDNNDEDEDEGEDTNMTLVHEPLTTSWLSRIYNLLI